MTQLLMHMHCVLQHQEGTTLKGERCWIRQSVQLNNAHHCNHNEHYVAFITLFKRKCYCSCVGFTGHFKTVARVSPLIARGLQIVHKILTQHIQKEVHPLR